MAGSFLKFTQPNGQKVLLEGEVLEHRAGIEYILGVMISEKYGCIKSLEEIEAVGHRVVHGGEKFNESVLIDDEVTNMIEECIDLAPLHNPPNLKGIYAINELMPGTPQVAVFDTAFHQTLPDYAYFYPLPYSLYEKHNIRRYGFHGTSHRYVSHRVCEFFGCSLRFATYYNSTYRKWSIYCCNQNGKSIDTSMGMNPVEGLMMGTAPAILIRVLFRMLWKKSIWAHKVFLLLINKFSGVLGISGISSDMREVEDAVNRGEERAKLAMKMYNYRIKKVYRFFYCRIGRIRYFGIYWRRWREHVSHA